MNIEMQNIGPHTVPIQPTAPFPDQPNAPSIQDIWNTYPSLGKPITQSQS